MKAPMNVVALIFDAYTFELKFAVPFTSNVYFVDVVLIPILPPSFIRKIGIFGLYTMSLKSAIIPVPVLFN